MTNNVTYQNLPVFMAGLIDGIIVPLTVYSFFSAVLEQQNNVILITMVTGICMAIFLSVGAYLTRKGEIEHSEENKLAAIYNALEINEGLKQLMTEDTLKEKEIWQQQWNESENDATNLSPGQYASTTGFGYLIGLLLVLLNGYFNPTDNLQFLILPLTALALAGFVKHKIAGQNPFIGMLTVLLSGALAAISNWLVAGLF